MARGISEERGIRKEDSLEEKDSGNPALEVRAKEEKQDPREDALTAVVLITKAIVLVDCRRLDCVASAVLCCLKR